MTYICRVIIDTWKISIIQFVHVAVTESWSAGPEISIIGKFKLVLIEILIDKVFGNKVQFTRQKYEHLNV